MIGELCRLGESADTLREYLTELAADSVDKVQIMLSQRDDARYTPLHVAIFERNIDAVKILIEFGADVNAKCHSTPCLQLALRTAAQPGGLEFGFACFHALLTSPNVNISSKDDNNMTIMHLAAFYDFPDIISAILNLEGGKTLVDNCSKTTGLTALHLAAVANSEASAKLLLQSGASPSKKLTICGSNALHCAASAKASAVWKLLCSHDKSLLEIVDNAGQTAKDILTQDGWSISEDSLSITQDVELQNTAIVYGPICSQHYTCVPAETRSSSAPPENLHRLHVLIDKHDGILRSKPLIQHLEWFAQSSPCPLADVLRVHEWSYVRRVQAKCETICENVESPSCIDSLDGDTAVSRHTFDAALVAAGAVCTGVDKVMKKQAANAFCPVRPPGHHAGPLGAVKGEDGSESHGFCILNNVSIGAAYAMNHYRDQIKKVAIVDFDVHHGNGTEETVRWLQPHCTETEYFNNNGFGKMYTPRYKPWFSEKDSDNVLFVSVHGYGPRQRGLESLFPAAAFYPGSGKTVVPEISSKTPSVKVTTEDQVPSQPQLPIPCDSDSEDGKIQREPCDDNDEEEDDDEGDEDYEDYGDESSNHSVQGDANVNNVQGLRALYSSTHESSHSAAPLILDIGVSLSSGDFSTPIGKLTEDAKYRFQWRNYFRNIIFPRLMKFKPDMIFISAGFDAHKKDTINAGYISLIEEDFQWVTEKLVEIANSACEGRIVSVLEGGYQLGGEYTSAFAKSVFAHVHALAVGGQCRRKFERACSDLEAGAEAEVIRILETARDDDLKQRQQQLQLQQQSKPEQQPEITNYTETQATDDAMTNRKRRRTQVDYVALNKELEESGPSSRA